jgi:hypothetical protein
MSHARRVTLITCTAIILAALTRQPAFAQPNSQPNPYRTIENYFKLPDGRMLGGTAGIETDRDGVWLADGWARDQEVREVGSAP